MEPGSTARRFIGPAVIVLLAALIVLFVTIGVRAAATTPTPSDSGAAAPATSVIPTATAQPSSPASGTPGATAKPAASPAPTKRTEPTPQPTKTAAIAKPAPITPKLEAKVTRSMAVAGVAQGPGEIAGPSVQLTIEIANHTGKAVDLSNTVVNATYGSAATPAIPLEKPGGRVFPASVANGATASGVFVFNIPLGQRGKVQVTVDTSVDNAVVAFDGAVPR